KGGEHEGDGYQGDGVYDADEGGLMRGFDGERKAEESRKGEAEEDKEEEEEERGEGGSAPPLKWSNPRGFFERGVFSRGGLYFRRPPLPGPLLRGRRGRPKNRKALEQFCSGDAGDGGAGGGHDRGAHDGGGVVGLIGGKNGDGGDGDELDGTCV